jgi:hypothetical protein
MNGQFDAYSSGGKRAVTFSLKKSRQMALV